MTANFPSRLGIPIEDLSSYALLFVHQMKSGGVTLNHILRDLYAPSEIFKIDGKSYRQDAERFIGLSSHDRSRYKLILGHMFVGLHRFIPRPSVYLTMLREPVSRIISMYYYQLRPDHAFAVDRRISLIEYLEKGYALNADNGMTRFLAGVDFMDVPYGKCTDNMLAQAIENLERHFIAVGLTERFDESIDLFKRLLGLPEIPVYRARNRNIRKPSDQKLTDPEISAIERFNRLDIELYRYAGEWFEKCATA